MSLLRLAFGRLLGGVVLLALVALFLNALIQSQQHWQQSTAARLGPPPPLAPLSTLSPEAPRAEVNLLVRIDAAIDVALPGGTARLYLLADPSDPFGTPARGAVFVTPPDLAAFERLVADKTQTLVAGAPLLALNGMPGLPFWIDRAEAAAAEAQRPLSDSLTYIRPFLHGRAEGLAPSPLTLIIPALLLALILATLAFDARRLWHRRQMRHALTRLDALDREVEAAAALSIRLQPGDPGWIDLTSRRQILRRKRAELDARLGTAPGLRPALWLWAPLLALGAALALVPRRPLFDALATHIFGRSAAGDAAALDRALGAILSTPGDLVAAALVALAGPQTVTLADQIRAMPFVLWAAMALCTLALLRRGRA